MILYALMALATYFIWCYIHEFSHLLMASGYRDISDWTVKPYPHKHNGKFYWARVEYKYIGKELSDREQAAVAFAPRLMDCSAVAALCICYMLQVTNPYFLIFLSGGVVDLITGSVGYSNTSDLQRYSTGFDLPTGSIRVLQGFAATIGILCLLGLLL